MTALRELQEAMRAALHDGREDALLPHVLGGARTPAQRLAVYSGMYLWRLVQALVEDFPVVRRLLGEALFERVSVTHLKRRPSMSPSLAFLGRGLDETLEHLGLSGEAALARLEWARVEAFWAPDAAVLAAADLGAFGERLGEQVLVLHPSLRLLELPLGALEVAGGAGLEALSPERAQRVAVWRKGFEVREEPLGPAEAEALRRALAGSDVAAVCEAFADSPEPGPAAIAALVEWVGDGWICGCHSR